MIAGGIKETNVNYGFLFIAKEEIHIPNVSQIPKHSTVILCDCHLQGTFESKSFKSNLKCYRVVYFSACHKCGQHVKLKSIKTSKIHRVEKVFYLEVRSKNKTKRKTPQLYILHSSKIILGENIKNKLQNISSSISCHRMANIVVAINLVLPFQPFSWLHQKDVLLNCLLM